MNTYPPLGRFVGLVAALVVAVVGLGIVLFSPTFGQQLADAALREAGGSMDARRYEIVMQLNAEAFRIVGAILLAVGAFVGLRRV
jgi:hypothetical protein